MKKWFFLAVAVLACLSSCSKYWGWTDEGYYSRWATAYFWGNSKVADNARFSVHIKQGATYDEEHLNSGTEIKLEIVSLPTESLAIPSGEYVVSDEREQPFTIQPGAKNLASGSIFTFRDYSDRDWISYPIESGTVRIDQHGENNYSFKLFFVAGGEYFEYAYDGDVWVVDSSI